MKIAALIGIPASGKSTIARGVVSRLSMPVEFKDGLIFGTEHERDKVIVFGRYKSGDVYPGTDKFSMGVQPQAIAFVDKVLRERPDWSIFFEGDRLGTLSYFQSCRSKLTEAGSFQLFMTQADPEVVQARHRTRNDSQSNNFLKGRLTKVSNIINAMDHTILKNNTDAECLAAISEIHGFLTGKIIP